MDNYGMVMWGQRSDMAQRPHAQRQNQDLNQGGQSMNQKNFM